MASRRGGRFQHLKNGRLFLNEQARLFILAGYVGQYIPGNCSFGALTLRHPPRPTEERWPGGYLDKLQAAVLVVCIVIEPVAVAG